MLVQKLNMVPGGSLHKLIVDLYVMENIDFSVISFKTYQFAGPLKSFKMPLHLLLVVMIADIW